MRNLAPENGNYQGVELEGWEFKTVVCFNEFNTTVIPRVLVEYTSVYVNKLHVRRKQNSESA